MFSLSQLPPYPIDIHNPLCRIVMTQNLSVKFTQSISLALSEVVPVYERAHFVDEAVVRCLISFGIG